MMEEAAAVVVGGGRSGLRRGLAILCEFLLTCLRNISLLLLLLLLPLVLVIVAEEEMEVDSFPNPLSIFTHTQLSL